MEDGEYYYYVDSTGKRVKNQWVSIDNEDAIAVGEQDVDTLWYYFAETGKAVKGTEEIKTKTLSWSGGSNKFIFDTEGHMMSGWVGVGEKNTYYLGSENEGWAHTGWQYLEVPEGMNAAEYEDQEWFYFDGGKAVKDKTKYISGAYYTFNEDGVLEDEWMTQSTPPEASGTNVFGNVSGAKNGWVYTSKPSDPDSSAWFYLVTTKQGTKLTAFGSDLGKDEYLAKSIGGKTYIFGEDGVMKDGLVTIKKATKASWQGVTAKVLEPGKYFCSKASASQGKDGRVLSGKQSNDEDGETFYYYFDKKDNGRAIENAIQDGIYYGPDGKRVQAEDGNTNQVITLAESITKINGKSASIKGKVIVNTSGRIRKEGTVKIEEDKYEVKDYVIIKKNGEAVE